MGTKTSQLQIRVTEQEKAALKRLAAAAGVSVSRYVLSQVLPSTGGEPSSATGEGHDAPEYDEERPASGGAGARPHFEELARMLADIPADDFQEALASLPIDRVNPVLRNQVAGLVEAAAHAKATDPPDWVREVTPPDRPHFGWPLASLRAHQIRVTPVPFKRRNIFFDPASPRGIPAVEVAPETGRPGRAEGEAQARLRVIGEALAKVELKVEFYLLGGAVLFQAFRARPATAHASALFAPAGLVDETARSVGEREGWAADWLTSAVKETLGGGRPDRYLDGAGLAAFVPLAEYVLALKVGSLRPDGGARALDDVRYLLRVVNLTSVAAALEITSRYLSGRQLAPDTEATLRGLLGE